MATCPNKAHPDWKALVAQVGEKGANLAYVKNGFDIPRQDGLKQRPKKISIIEKIGFGRRDYSFANTMDSLLNHPEIASQMIDELKSLFPDVKVFKDRIIDENGKYLEIPSDKQGRHYRNAFLSAVAWSNDSAMETPPHEYAHEYIDMFRETEIVKKAIEKYGEERLVTLIARKYAGQKMSNSFESTLKNIWKSIRSFFGAPSVIDTLTDSFAKNETLGQQYTRGSNAVHNFQDTNGPILENKTAFNFNKDTEKASEPVRLMTNEEASDGLFSELFKEEESELSPDDMVNKFRAWWGGSKNNVSLKEKIISATRMPNGSQSNIAPMDSSKMDIVQNILNSDNENIKAILSKIKGEDIKLNEDQSIAFNNLLDLYKGLKYKQKVNKSIVSTDVDNPSMISEDVVTEIAVNEVSNTFKERFARLAKKNPVFRYIDKFLTKGLRHVTNPRLWAKYLSGNENSMVSRVLYKGLNDGRVKYSEFSNTFKKILVSKPTSYYEGSSFHNPNFTIEQLETKNIQLDKTINKNTSEDSVDLTKSELLMLYLIGRQEGGLNNLRDGVILRKIKGRKASIENNYKFTDAQLNEIMSEIQGDTQAQELVAEIDKAMEYNHTELNKTFRVMEGFDLEKIENYFPMFHGEHNPDINKSKNIIEDMRNLRLRTSNGLAVRLEDPFKVLSGVEMSNASYIAYAIPIHNATKMIDSLNKNRLDEDDEGDYIGQLKGVIARIQDNSLLYSTQGDKDAGKLMSKLQGNFSVALLAYNPGVIFKQQLSLITARASINEKYIRKSGANLGIVSLINPVDLFKRLTLKGSSTMLPVEWKQITDNRIYQILMKHPMYRDRFNGMVSRETGEAVMGRRIHDDLITIPGMKGKDGKPVQISKSRLMMGITMMDSLTIMRLYASVELETKDRMGEADFKNLTAEQIELHNVNRLQEIIDETQPTFDQTNRSGLAANTDPRIRVLTMFSSATQKIGQQMLDSMIEYNQNPTKANLKKLTIRMYESAILTGAGIASINILWAMMKGGWDDDDYDSIGETYALEMLKSSIGSIHGVGSALNIITSQLDSKPYSVDIQDPVIGMIQEGAEATANLTKGNFLKAIKGYTNVTAKGVGIPVTPINIAVKGFEKLTSDN
jgi:hypothetical protein